MVNDSIERVQVAVVGLRSAAVECALMHRLVGQPVASVNKEKMQRSKKGRDTKPDGRGGTFMALVKRGKTWHCDFVIDGVRYRESTGKTDWREAQQKERELYKEAENGGLAANAKRRGMARLMFKDAAEQFTRDREPNIAANSAKA